MQALQNFGQFTGTLDRTDGTLGYVKQDIGTEMIVIAAQCVGFGGILPPAGTRVKYDVVLDPMLGILRADSVQPEAVQPSSALVVHQPQPHQLVPPLYPFNPASVTALATQLETGLAAQPAPVARAYSEGRKSGIFEKEKGTYGFITQDTGEPEMFVMPRACAAFGGAFPPLGTRVVFEVVASDRTGKPRAENVRPGFSGTMAKVKGNYGFIQPDIGDAEMFVMPRGCPFYDDNFPPIGTRVTYEVVTSDRTGKPRAEDVQPMFKPGAEGPASQSLQNVNLGMLPVGALPVLQQQADLIPQLGQPSDLLALEGASVNLDDSAQQMATTDDMQNPKRRKILES